VSKRDLSPEQKLHEKLFKARKEAAAVAKKGDGKDFKYARFEDVSLEANRLLEKHRLLIVPAVVGEDITFSRSRPLAFATVVMDFAVIDLTSGGELLLRWSGTADDEPGGKALFKAQTGCEKYFLAKLLRIPFGTDPEGDEPQLPEESSGNDDSTFLDIPPESDDAERVRAEQDRSAEAAQVPRRHEKPLPDPGFPEPDYEGLIETEGVGANA
jgi:ERF superfamily